MPPLVSVVIPVYNAEEYIIETINSVLNQTYTNWELIIVNDGSVDNSVSLIEKLIVGDDRISLISKINTGVSDSRNFGLLKAKGDYVAFLDADDVWLKNNLQSKITTLLQTKTDAVYSFCEIINETSKRTGHVKKGSENITLDNVLLWEANYITIPSGFIYSTDVIKLLGGYSKALSNNADQELLMRLLARNKTISLYPHITWLYRKHSKNMSSNIIVMEKDTLETYNLAVKNNYFKSKAFKRQCLAKMYLVLAGSWWKDGDNKMRGLLFIFKALFLNPFFTINTLLKK